MGSIEPKRWQNLVHKKCPNCDERLKWQGDWFKCPTAGCFAINSAKLVEILTDKSHIIQQFLSPHERQIIEDGIINIVKMV